MNHSTFFESASNDGAWRTITRDEIYGAAAAFMLVHRGCKDAVDIFCRDGLLLCRCDRCEDTRNYEVIEP